jgi:hypothetical protein
MRPRVTGTGTRCGSWPQQGDGGFNADAANPKAHSFAVRAGDASRTTPARWYLRVLIHQGRLRRHSLVAGGEESALHGGGGLGLRQAQCRVAELDVRWSSGPANAHHRDLLSERLLDASTELSTLQPCDGWKELQFATDGHSLARRLARINLQCKRLAFKGHAYRASAYCRKHWTSPSELTRGASHEAQLQSTRGLHAISFVRTASAPSSP